MQNPEKVEAFYKDYLNGKDSMVTVFDVHRDGLIGAVASIFRNGQLQTCYIGVRWKKDGTPEIESISMNNVAEINLTEKGYFIYAYETVIAHGCIRQYWRVSPLSEYQTVLESQSAFGRVQGTDEEIHLRTQLCGSQCTCYRLGQQECR